MMKPRLAMKFELTYPGTDESPPRKFAVNKQLKAQWSENPEEVNQQVMNEIKTYKGSFMGDMLQGMKMIVDSEINLNTPEHVRSYEVCRWISDLFDSMIYTGIREGIHRDLLDSTDLIQWDGDVTKIDPVTPDEIKNADVEKILLLLAPKIKQALYLISKDARRRVEDNL